MELSKQATESRNWEEELPSQFARTILALGELAFL
jgi:hypothetical protein